MLVCQFGIHFNCAIKSIELVPKCIMFDVAGIDDFWIKGHYDLISEPEILFEKNTEGFCITEVADYGFRSIIFESMCLID